MVYVKVSSPYPLEYAHSTDAGADIRANERAVIPVGKRRLVCTGIFLGFPDPDDELWNGQLFEAQIRPRSGLAHNYGVTVLNSPGTIDQGFRGEVKVNLINHGDAPFEIEPGDRIAQLVFSAVEHVKFDEVEFIEDDTDRGASGHGSTGVK